ncbi:hypothetical protein S40288_07217 [Stachybotrys chartarum IBT 40288]|nr:hypothetical protein S40288_07217 [Stachybotrys chartarum IBT 40288]
MSEEDIDALGPDGQGSAARVDRDRRAPRFSWTPAYEATFFRSLCESVRLGLRENSSFKAEAWERAAQALQSAHAAMPTKSHLINKSDNARKRFRLWRGLREDPDFTYNQTARTVSATEEAWRAHIEREPLSRALRGRPFDHEDYMEVLYPDVIGSGGAPKRIMKPRRRTDGQLEDADMPGTSILQLSAEPSASASDPSSPDHHRPSLSQTTSSSSAQSLMQPTNRTKVASVPPRATPAAGAALTPPDDPTTTTQGRKRPLASVTPQTSYDDGPVSAGGTAQDIPEKRRRTSALGVSILASSSAPVPPPTSAHSAAAKSPNAGSDSLPQSLRPLLEEFLDLVRTRAAPRWREEALDLFFRDFADEELDLQVKISENVLSNENKAMVFCKMPDRVRQHWVKRFRELHHKSA